MTGADTCIHWPVFGVYDSTPWCFVNRRAEHSVLSKAKEEDEKFQAANTNRNRNLKIPKGDTRSFVYFKMHDRRVDRES